MKKNVIYLLLIVISLPLAAQQRIVTAGSSSSEIVCALGYCDKIVATDRTSVYPEHLQGLPSIGYRNSIGAEGIISQNPDLVILEEEYVKDALVEQLLATGIPTEVVTQDRTWESTRDRIDVIAEALDEEDAGQELITELEQELAEVKQLVESSDQRPKVLGVYARGAGSMQVGGSDSPFSIIELAGAQNAVPKIEGFKPLNTESLIKANPDYILFFDSGLQSLGGIDGVLEIPGVAQTTAGKQRQIISINGVKLTNWGPRVAEAARELFYLTHPEEHAQRTDRPEK
ncbi:heme/hemin ABC transporter substrate-binding protein [Tunicatimonas pelagia]|uniref:heme/hemin ABC transporter substrate-binding protein n=1 Tax=Tunicatimonas pelagia TaxID=931531 RepID=UPI002666067D|nr:ABC transporter substrate-binding protein [Tunicatimonas pelagia]WKN43021.1 ABC transporter substrate-binding protein [Tunicatimonas pelagia]